jgi:hypothetical protein
MLVFLHDKFGSITSPNHRSVSVVRLCSMKKV